MGILRPSHVRLYDTSGGCVAGDGLAFSESGTLPARCACEWPDSDSGTEGGTEEGAEGEDCGVAWGGRFLQRRRMRRSSKSRAMGTMVSRESDHTTRTRSSRWGDVERVRWMDENEYSR